VATAYSKRSSIFTLMILFHVRPAWVLARRWESAMDRSSRNHELRTRVSTVRWNLKEV